MCGIALEDTGYWEYILLLIVCAIISIDITFNLSTIFISTSLSHLQQGLAGAISSTLTSFSMAVFIAFTDIIKTSTLLPLGLWKSY
jgi:hypothetical protein